MRIRLQKISKQNTCLLKYNIFRILILKMRRQSNVASARLWWTVCTMPWPQVQAPTLQRYEDLIFFVYVWLWVIHMLKLAFPCVLTIMRAPHALTSPWNRLLNFWHYDLLVLILIVFFFSWSHTPFYLASASSVPGILQRKLRQCGPVSRHGVHAIGEVELLKFCVSRLL